MHFVMKTGESGNRCGRVENMERMMREVSILKE